LRRNGRKCTQQCFNSFDRVEISEKRDDKFSRHQTQPFPTAFTYFREKKLTIWKCDVANVDHTIKSPGQIIKADSGELLIFCGGDSVLRIDELQLEGKRRVTVRDFMNGVRPQPGDVLGK